MKKLLSTIATFLLVIVAVQTAKAGDRPIQFNQLPAKAQTFVKQHFSVKEVASVWQDTDFTDRDYKVVFNNGSEVEFRSNGEWKEVETHQGAVPAKIIPNNITQYVKKQFPDTDIQKIKKERYGYEVELSNGLDLEFNSQGKFLRMDD